MSDDDAIAQVDAVMARARHAQANYETHGSQELYDKSALAVGWAIMEPSRNREMAEFAVETTGLGNAVDKFTKNHRKTLGLLRDIQGVKTFGVIEKNPDTGITKIARPIGVIGAVVPSTNPIATPANNIINALKCGNAIVLSPSPTGVAVCDRLLGYIHAEFSKIGLDHDLVQMIPPPGSKDKTQRMLESADLVVVTGSQDNVRRAYRSGTPAIGVGAGNATVIVDETADLDAAASKIAASKCFDNATSCSSENSLIVVDAIYDDFVTALTHVGGAVLPREKEPQIVSKLFHKGHLNRDAIAQDADKMMVALGLKAQVPADTKFICIETHGVGHDFPLSDEKLSRTMAIYRVADFHLAKAKAKQILHYKGAGHSVGLHSKNDARAEALGKELPVCRVIVNQGHCFATGGAFNNGMPFSLSMGCGSWGGNSIDENLHWKHFLNITRIVREIPEKVPKLEDIFNHYWNDANK